MNHRTYFFNSKRMWCSLAVGNIVLILATVASVSIGVGFVNDVSWVCCWSSCWWFLIRLPTRGVWGDERDREDISWERLCKSKKLVDPITAQELTLQWMFERVLGNDSTYDMAMIRPCRWDRTGTGWLTGIALESLNWVRLSGIHLNVFLWGAMHIL